MEIKVSEIYEKEGDLVNTCDKLNKIILGEDWVQQNRWRMGRSVELYELNEDSNIYDYVSSYKVEEIVVQDDEIVFKVGSNDWDICTIKLTDKIKIIE